MENLFSTLSTNTGNTTNTTNASDAIMNCPQNSQFSSLYGPLSYSLTPSNSLLTQSNCYPLRYHVASPSVSLQLPYTHFLEQPCIYPPSADPFYPFMVAQNANKMRRPCLSQPNVSELEQERRVLDAYKTKMARSKRKLARQRSINKNSFAPNSAQTDGRRLGSNGDGQSSKSNSKKDLYMFLKHDNKRLRVLLRKDLKNSDVGSLGRIVLPKRETEENLPALYDKEGIFLVLRDMYSNQEWPLKFKYWSNNKTRMYVLESTGDFVKHNGLQIGDSLTLYEDESKNLRKQYFSIQKVERPSSEPSRQQQPINQSHNYLYITNTHQARDEGNSSLGLIIEQLENREEANSHVTVPMDFPSSYTGGGEESKNSPFNNQCTSYAQPPTATVQPSSTNEMMRVVDDTSHVDDCYTGLGILPDVYKYNFSL